MEVDTMLMRTDPFRELDRLTQQIWGTQGTPGTLARPGVRPDAIDLDVERNVVTVRAERPPRDDDVEPLAAERPRGVFSRQLVLGDNLDTEHITAGYEAGVLSLEIPVAEAGKPRKITVSGNGQDRQAINA